jgi:hypothetical protein
MAFDIAVRTHEFSGNEDRTWLKTRKGFDTCRSITLDVSTFLAAHVSAKGAIPSGTVLGKITASGKYGPYDNSATDGRQTAVGFLFNTTIVGKNGSDTDLSTAADVGAPLLWEGVVAEASLPAFTGTVLGEVDANGKTDLTFVRFE